MRLFASFLFGLFAEIATGLVIAAGMALTGAGMSPSRAGEFPAWVPIVAIVAGSVFTFLIAFWRAARDKELALTHALLVAAGAVTLHLATSVGAGQALTAFHVVADVLKIVAGAVAGDAVRRRARFSSSVV